MANNRKESPDKRLAIGLSEAHLALAQQVAHVGSWEMDLVNLKDIDSNLLHWSDETFRLLGYVPGEVEPSNDLFFKAVHPDDRQKIQDSIAQAIEDHLPYKINHRVIWPDGTERVLHEQSTIVYDNDGRPLKMLGVVQDITHRAQTQSSQEMPSLILRHMRDSVIVTDLDGQVIYWNRGAAAIFGYSQDEMLGVSLSRLYPTREVRMLRSDLDQLLAGKEFDGEWEALRRDGARLWLRSSRTVLRDDDLRPIGFIGVSKDITWRKREEEAVRESETLYRAIGESFDFGVWSCDPAGHLTHMSDSFMKVLGLTPAQNLGDGWLNALHPEERESFTLGWRECLKAGKPWDRRCRVLGADGRYRAVLTHAAPVRNDKGEILCWAGLNLDLDRLR